MIDGLCDVVIGSVRVRLVSCNMTVSIEVVPGGMNARDGYARFLVDIVKVIFDSNTFRLLAKLVGIP